MGTWGYDSDLMLPLCTLLLRLLFVSPAVRYWIEEVHEVMFLPHLAHWVVGRPPADWVHVLHAVELRPVCYFIEQA